MVMMLPTQSQKRLLKPPIRAHFTKPKIFSSKIKKARYERAFALSLTEKTVVVLMPPPLVSFSFL